MSDQASKNVDSDDEKAGEKKKDDHHTSIDFER